MKREYIYEYDDLSIDFLLVNNIDALDHYKLMLVTSYAVIWY